MNHQPLPGIVVWLVRLTAPASDREAILGDLAEGLARRWVSVGPREARKWTRRQALLSCWPNIKSRLRVRWPRQSNGNRGSRMGSIRYDIRYAIRSLSRAPGFTGLAIVALALGIGSTTVIYSLVNDVVLSPFPAAMDRTVIVGSAFPRTGTDLGFIEVNSAAEFDDVAQGATKLTNVVGFDIGNRVVIDHQGPERVRVAFWWGDAFGTIGMPPAAGRGFDGDDLRGRSRVAVISHRMWRNRYQGNSSVIGEVLRINGEPFTIVGVMPREVLLLQTDVWLPMWADPSALPRDRRQFQVLGRMAPGATIEQVNGELETIAAKTEADFADRFPEYRGWHLEATSWTALHVANHRTLALLLLGAIGFVVLLVSVSVANLVMARASRKRRELGVRLALGARRGRLVQQIAMETGLLGAAAGLAGILLAAAGHGLALSLIPAGVIPQGVEPTLDSGAVVFGAGVAIATMLVFGLVPALHASGIRVLEVLQAESGQMTGSRGAQKLQRVFVTLQVAVAVVLLSGSGMVVSSFLELQSQDPGFDPAGTLAFRITLPWEQYDGRIPQFFEELERRVEEHPGISSAAVASQLPPSVFMRLRMTPEGMAGRQEGQLPAAYLTIVTPGYFETLGIPLLGGRSLSADDRPAAPPVAVINEAAALEFFGNVNSVGRRIKLGTPSDDDPELEVVGVVASVRNRGLMSEPLPEVYVAEGQAGNFNNQQLLVARAEGDPMSALPALRDIVRSLDPGLPVYNITTLDDSFSSVADPQRLAATLLTLFAFLALVLAAMGIYGVVAYGVTRRTREIGVRVALGAERAAVRRMIMRQALWPVVTGFVAGSLGSWLLGRALAGMLFGPTSYSTISLSLATTVLLCAALLAAWVPATRAARLDPVSALRWD